MDIVLDTQTEEAEMHRHPGNRYLCVLGNKKKSIKVDIILYPTHSKMGNTDLSSLGIMAVSGWHKMNCTCCHLLSFQSAQIIIHCHKRTSHKTLVAETLQAAFVFNCYMYPSMHLSVFIVSDIYLL